MILCTGNPKDATKKLLAQINKYSKSAGYKINRQKSLAFLFMNNENSERQNFHHLEQREEVVNTHETRYIINMYVYYPSLLQIKVRELSEL